MTLNNENNTDYLKIAQRPNFFAGQYLLEDDFEDLHNYHDAQQRLHHRFLHVSGIIEGLVVTVPVAGQKKVKVSAGTAIDPQGNVIVLAEEREVNLISSSNSGELYITFKESEIKQQEDSNPITFTRYLSAPEIAFAESRPAGSVTLATLTISGNTVTPDPRSRQMSGVLLPSPGGRLSLRYQGNHQAPGEHVLETALLAGHLSVKGDLSVTGNSTLTGSLTVNNTVFLKGAADKTGLTIDNQGNTTLGGTLTVTDNSTLNGTLKLKEGTAIKQFSSTIPLTNSSDSVPTESVVKTYVDAINTTLTSQKADKAGASNQDFNAKILTVAETLTIGSNRTNVATALDGKANKSGATTENFNAKDLSVAGNLTIGSNNLNVATALAGKAEKSGSTTENFNANNLTVAGALSVSQIKIPSSKTGVQNIELLPQGTGTGAAYQAGQVIVGSSTANQGANLAVHGNVGIGTPNPSERLEIQRTGTGTAALNFLSIYNDRTDNNTQENRIVWKYGTNRTTAAAIASRPGASLNAGDLRFQTATNGNLQERMIIDSLGNVGIGTTTTPTARLNVNGTVTATSFQGSGASLTGLTGSQIQDSTITNNKLADNSVSAPKMQDGSVGESKLASNAVTEGKIANDAVTNSKIANNAINTAELADGAVTTNKLNNGSVTWDKLANNARSWIIGSETLSYSGNVGIGTTTPAAKLAINGGLHIGGDSDPGSGNLQIGGRIRIVQGVIQKGGGSFIIDTGDLGLYSLEQGGWIRFVTNNGPINFYTDSGAGTNPRMTIVSGGNVGIGTQDPTQAKLVVMGTSSLNYSLAPHSTFGKTGGGSLNDSTYNVSNVSIYAQERIVCDMLSAFSDERIKNIQGRSDSTLNLQILLGIEITDFFYKDTISKGNALQKKVIGQQVEQVFPQSVSKQVDVVPDIYKLASIKDDWVLLATDLKPGERVKLITEMGKESIHEVLEVTPEKFRPTLKLEGDNVFVFGREVNDFRIVDYDAISMLNVSATQEIHKQLRALQIEVEHLKSIVHQLK